MHPVTKCSTVSKYSLHIRHLLWSINPLGSFNNLVCTICSNMVMITAAFPGLRFWDNHKWHSCSCFLYNLLSCSFFSVLIYPLLFHSLFSPFIVYNLRGCGFKCRYFFGVFAISVRMKIERRIKRSIWNKYLWMTKKELLEEIIIIVEMTTIIIKRQLWIMVWLWKVLS